MAHPDRRRRRPLVVLAVAALAVLLAAVGAVAWQVAATPKAFALTRVNKALTPIVPGRPIWLLVLGDDLRVENGTRVGCGCADAIHVVGIPAGGGQATILNIPRDTVWTNGRRVNTVLRSGPNRAALTIGRRLGIPIHYVAVTNFDGLRGFIDAIGGVTVPVERAVVDPAVGIDLPRGHVWMDGATALAYARSRKPFRTGDLERSRNQANVMLAVFAKLRDADASELFTYTRFLTASNVSFAELEGLVGLLRSIDPAAVRNQNLPTVIRGRSLRISPAASALLRDLRPDAVLNRAYNPLGMKNAVAPEPLPAVG